VSDDTVAGEGLRLRTGDGSEIAADLAVPDHAWAGAVLCHPHPAYGGDRHNIVVDRLFRTLPVAGVAAARFDFRLAGRPGAAAPTGGPAARAGEQLDVRAALDLVAGRIEPGRPLWLVGYSFGADVALSVDDDRVAGWVAVAPPLRFGPPPRPGTGDPRPVLVLAAEHDQYNPPERLRQAVASWADATVTVVPMADHFLAGATSVVAGVVLDWIRARSNASAP
jgi:uncharacterized protein